MSFGESKTGHLESLNISFGVFRMYHLGNLKPVIWGVYIMLFWESGICQLEHFIYRVKNMSFGGI